MSDALDRLVERFCAAYGWGLPDWDGNVMNVGVFSPGLRGVERPVPWQAFAIESAPGLRGQELRFAYTADRRIVSGRKAPPASAQTILTALAKELEPPFCGVALRLEDDVWAGAANQALVLELPRIRAEEIEVSRIGGRISTSIHGVTTSHRYPAIEAVIAEQDSDATVVAHRFAGSAWIADVFPL